MAKRKRTAPPLRRMIALNGGSAPFAHSVAKSRFCVSPFPPNRNGLRVGSRVRADSRNVVFRFAEMMGKEANFRVFGARREGGSEGAFFFKNEKKGRRRTFGGRKGEKSKGRLLTCCWRPCGPRCGRRPCSRPRRCRPGGFHRGRRPSLHPRRRGPESPCRRGRSLRRAC